MTDGEIVELFWAREQRALTETEARYGLYLGKVAERFLDDREDRREVVNDTLLKAWNAMPPHRPASLSAFLAKIARQTAIDRLRRQTGQKRGGSAYDESLAEWEDALPDVRTPETETERRLLAEAVNTFVKSLSDDARRIFVRRYFFLQSVAEIADTLGVSEAKVKSSLFRTRSGLKNWLEREDLYK